MDRSVRAALAATAAVAALAVTASACTSDDASSAASTGSSGTSPSGTSPSGTSPSGTSPSTTSTPAGDDASAVTITAPGPISLRVGQQATIELAANRTTGYEWSPTAQPDAAVVTTVSDTYVAPGTGRVGAGGTQRIVVRGVAPGTTTLAMGYSRPWEHDTPPAQTATFDITVT